MLLGVNRIEVSAHNLKMIVDPIQKFRQSFLSQRAMGERRILMKISLESLLAKYHRTLVIVPAQTAQCAQFFQPAFQIMRCQI